MVLFVDARDRLPTVLRVVNETHGTTLVERGRVASSFWARGKGLLGTKSLPAGEGLLIERCQSIHSFWMQYPFDAAFLNREGRVLHVIHAMKQNRMSRHLFSAHSVLELPADVLKSTGTEVGDILRCDLVPADPI